MAILVLYAIAIFAKQLAPYSPTDQLDIVRLKLQSPSSAHPLGTDDYSRDVLSRLIYGARVSLSIATLAVLLSATIGLAYGVISGYAGGRIDAVMMRLLDAFLSIPRVLLLLAVLALWAPVQLPALIVLLGVTGWFAVSRLVRAEVLSVKQREFVLAARALGASDREVIWHHVVPNVLAPVIVAASLGIGNVIVLEAGLSFLGTGTREPNASWGLILNSGSDALATAWWVALFPGVAIIITVLAFNTLGDALRDALDPRQLPGASPPPAIDASVQQEMMSQRG